MWSESEPSVRRRERQETSMGVWKGAWGLVQGECLVEAEVEADTAALAVKTQVVTVVIVGESMVMEVDLAELVEDFRIRVAGGIDLRSMMSMTRVL